MLKSGWLNVMFVVWVIGLCSLIITLGVTWLCRKRGHEMTPYQNNRREKIMFFIASDSEIINVNAILIIPVVPKDANDQYIMEVEMVDGKIQSMYAKDVLAIRELVISRLL